MRGRLSYSLSLLFLSVFLAIIGCSSVQGDEAVLMDTRTATSDLGWVKPPDSEWQDASGLRPDADGRRNLVVCQVHKPKQNNWFRSPFIESNGAQRVYVEFEFTIRACEGIAEVATCKETFNLFYYETDRDEATTTFPPWNEEAYTKVDTVAGDRRFRRGSKETNFEVRDIGPLTKNGLYIALQDTGACIAIMHVRVFYKYCPPTEANLARFPRTNTGAEHTTLIEVEGLCITNSIQEIGVDPSSLFCNSEGEWVVPKGRCSCDVGYAPNRDMTQCKACNEGYYKSDPGNNPCLKCPAYSHSVNTGSSICECMIGYYRGLSDTALSPCSKPPSKPIRARATSNDTGIVLTWKPPINDGGRNDLSYRIGCMECKAGFVRCNPCSNTLHFTPSNFDLHVTKVTVERYDMNKVYKFNIYAENGVSEISDDQNKEINYATVNYKPIKKNLPSVTDLKAYNIGINAIYLTWSYPQTLVDGSLEYEVIIQDYNSNKILATMKSSNTNATVNGLLPNKAYFIKVRAHERKLYGAFCSPIKIRTRAKNLSPPQPAQENELVSLNTLLGVFAGVVVVVIILIFVFLVCRRKKRFKRKTAIDFKKHPMFSAGSLLSPGVVLNRKKTYVDPTTYGNPHRALLEFAKELSASYVSVEATIGGGEFGNVCRGYVKKPPDGAKKQQVAIKTLKNGYTEDQKMDFLSEASIMGQFDHPNVIRLEGVVTKIRPFMIITEYMENGALDAFLRKHDGEFPILELLRMLRNIASGMKYLSDMGYVHRDLAARNILVNSEMICKVSDFGLSRVLEEDENATYITRGGKIPVRWTAPEAITFRKFTSASDVWSFGIVMWEVLSYGERPYWGMPNRDVIEAIESGFRLPAPMDCPLLQHQLMLDCWKKDRNERPKFASILLRLDKMLRDPDVIKETVKMQLTNQQPDYVDEPPITNNHSIRSPTTQSLPSNFRDFSSHLSLLGAWLDDLGLGKYKDHFVKHGFVTKDQIIQMQLSDLKMIGIKDSYDQSLILRSIFSTHSNTLNRVQLLKKLEDNLTGVPV